MVLTQQPMSIMNNPPHTLSVSDGILFILDALEHADPPRVAKRALLEGIASVARLPQLRESTCPILAAFRTDDWLLRLHESISYLGRMNRLEHTADGFALTDEGRSHILGIAPPPGKTRENEYQRVNNLASKVRIGLGLEPGLMSSE